MVNTNVQSPVPLVGRGFTRRASQQYGPGEFYQLDNVFINERGLQSRYGIGLLGNNFYADWLGNDVKYYQDQYGFIGRHTAFNDDRTLVLGKSSLFGINNQTTLGTSASIYWNPVDLNGGTAHTNIAFTVPVKAFSYQDKNYFIIMKAVKHVSENRIDHYEYYLGRQSGTPESPPTQDLICSRPYTLPTEQDFVDSFIWKDRIWLITKDTVYFSGVGSANHITANWPSPNGGFVKYTGRIKTVQYVRDTLFVMTETEIYALTYNADPNADATNVRISARGADSSCIHDGTVYATDGEHLFTVSGSSVDKVMDLELFNRYPVPNMGGNSSAQASAIQTKMVAYKNKIVLIYYDTGAHSGLYGFSTPFLNRGIKLPVDSNTTPGLFVNENDDILSYPQVKFNNTFMIDMDNGSITRITFNDIQADPGSESIVYATVGAIVDANVTTDNKGNERLYLMTAARRGAAAAGTTWNFVYQYLDEPTTWKSNIDANGASAFDSFYTVLGGVNVSYVEKYSIPFSVIIHKFVPDGAEYLMKKFRTILMEGNLPEFTRYGFFYDRNLPTLTTVGAPSANQRRPKSYRFGLNQRGRSLSIIISRNTESSTDDASINTDVMTLEDMRIFWTYSGKPQSTKGGVHSVIL